MNPCRVPDKKHSDMSDVSTSCAFCVLQEVDYFLNGFFIVQIWGEQIPTEQKKDINTKKVMREQRAAQGEVKLVHCSVKVCRSAAGSQHKNSSIKHPKSIMIVFCS